MIIRTVGYIDLDTDTNDILFENEVGKFHTKPKGGKRLRVDVYSERRKHLPHFHFYESKKDSKNGIDGCAKIITPTYFNHGTKHTSTLGEGEVDKLDEFMRKQSDLPGFNNWEYCLYLWYDKKLDLKKAPLQPDYTKLNDDVYFRVTDKNGVGIYDAFKAAISKADWVAFLKSNGATWLPKPKVKYDMRYTSYFTEKGYRLFVERTYPTILQSISREDMVLDTVMINKRFAYNDSYQVIVGD